MCNGIYPSKGEHVHANADAAMKVAIVLVLEIEIVLEIEEKSLRRRETHHETGWCAKKNGKQLISCGLVRKMSCRSNCTPSLSICLFGK
jgi:hypothetical protein